MLKRIGVVAIVSAGLIGCGAGAASAATQVSEPTGVRVSSPAVAPIDSTAFAGDLKLFDAKTGAEELSANLTNGTVDYSPGSTETQGTVTITYQSTKHGEVVFNLKYTQYPVPPDPLWKLEGTLSVDHADYTVEAWSEPSGPYDFAGDATRDHRDFQIDLDTDEVPVRR